MSTPEAKLFGYADKIRNAAAELDWLKNIGEPKERDEALRHITTLHAVAMELAGDRSRELYAEDEETHVLNTIAAAGCACCNEVTAGPGWVALDEVMQ